MAQSKTRAPVRALNLTATQVATGAANEAARKTASKKALHAALALVPATDKPKAPRVRAARPDMSDLGAADALRAREQALAAVAAQRIDWEALGSVGDFAAYLAEQGFNPDGTVRTPSESQSVKHQPYTGPMLVLRDAAKHYVKGKNGNPHCNDAIARALDGLTREQVVKCLVSVLDLEGNPYAALNPGQQSMNLRNKARHSPDLQLADKIANWKE